MTPRAYSDTLLHRTRPAVAAQMLRRYAIAKALCAFIRRLRPAIQTLTCISRDIIRVPATGTRSLLNRSLTPRRGRTLNLATPSLAPLESASTRRGAAAPRNDRTKVRRSIPRHPSVSPKWRRRARSRRRSRPLRAVPLRGIGGHLSVVAGLRDRDVGASRRRSARSQGRRRAVKRGCPSVARARRRAARSS